MGNAKEPMSVSGGRSIQDLPDTGGRARVLILGGAGMLGHKVWQRLSPELDTWVTVRAPADEYRHLKLFDPARTIGGVDVTDFEALESLIDRVAPSVVVNCVGIVKQLEEAQDPVLSLALNARLPHRLAVACRKRRARLIHVSTDCVFSGKRGMYRETDAPDAEDLYGRTKFLGEVGGHGVVTLRTSLIGRELRGASGIVEWFLGNRNGVVDGYEKAIFSGLTTIALADLIAKLVRHHRELSGLYHVSAEPIDKLTLLRLLNDAYDANVMIRPSSAVRIDRSLDSTRFRGATGWSPKAWPMLVADMVSDPTPYEDWRRMR